VPHIPGVHDFGQFDAINTRTGRIAWTIHTPQLALSGIAVGGNLIFYGEENGQFHGADAATGRVLWTFDGTSIRHGGGSTSAPAVYMVRGREYVRTRPRRPDDRHRGRIPGLEASGAGEPARHRVIGRFGRFRPCGSSF